MNDGMNAALVSIRGFFQKHWK